MGKTIGIAIAVVVFSVSGLFLLAVVSGQSLQGTGEELTVFAQCIRENGALFYGATWCGHCQNQKKAFGEGAKELPYIECARKDSMEQEDVCADAKIESYPTWVFPDGTRSLGETSFETLAEKTGCTLPQVNP